MKLGAQMRPLAALLAAGVFPQLLYLTISPLLTRLFTPEDFGVYGVFVALSATMAALSGGRLEFAIPVAKSQSDAAALVLITFLIAVPVVALLTGLVSIAFSQYSSVLSISELKEYLVWLPFSALAILSFQLLQYWLLFHKNYAVVSRTRWTQGISMAALHLIAGFSALGALGMVVFHAFAQVLGTVVGLKEVWSSIVHPLRKLSLRMCGRLLYVNRGYPTVILPATIFNMLGQHLPVLLVGAQYGVGAAGFLAIAQRMCGTPLSLISQAIGQIYIAEAPRMVEHYPDQFKKTLAVLIRKMLIAGVIFLALIVIAAPYVTSKVFGESWRDAGVLMQILGIVFVLDFVVTPISLTLTFAKKYASQLSWDMARVVLIALTFSSGAIYDLTLFETMGILAFALSFSSVFYIGLIWGSLRSDQNTLPVDR